MLADPASIAGIPGEIAGHAESVLSTLTSLVTISPDLTTTPPTLDLMVGVPLALLAGALTPVRAAVDVVKDIVSSVASGDPATALTALIDAPATLANNVIAGFLGPELVEPDGTFPADQVSQFNPALETLGLPSLPVHDYAITVGGPSGLVDTVVNYLPQQVADALTGNAPEYAVSPVVAVEVFLHLSEASSSDAASDLPATLAAYLGAEPPVDPLSALSF